MSNATPSIRQLRYFVALAEARHFRKAAEAMGISQPSLSLQIANLESLLGIRLVERGRGPVTLTPAGREVLGMARRALDEVQAIVDVGNVLRGGVTGTIRLGASPSLGPYLLPRVVGRLHQTYPGLRLYIRENAPRHLRDELANGTHDVILSQLPVQGHDFVVRRLFSEPLLLTVAADHPLASRESVGVGDLRGLQMLSLGPEYLLHEQIAAICTEHGAELVRDYEGTSLDALRQMVGMGMGATLLPQLYVLSEIASRESAVISIPFARFALSRSIGMAWRKGSGGREIFDRITDQVLEVSRRHFGRCLRFDG